MKIVMIGPVPPPIGGISIHIQRLSAAVKERGLDCVIYNEAKIGNAAEQIFPIDNFRWFLFQIPFLRGDVLHFHTIDRRLRMILGVYKLFGKKMMLTIHGESLAEQLERSNRLVRRLLLRSLKSLDAIVCVNEATTKTLLDAGFRHEQVRTIPAYIHPVDHEEARRMIPDRVFEFMAGDGFVICANGFIRFHHEQDLYGVDLLIALVHQLKKQGITVRLLFAVLGVAEQTAQERKYYESLQQKLQAECLERYFYFYEVENSAFYPILERSHLFIRPTCTDGYGVSVAEALHYAVPAIASDVCKRPTGTILFPSRDVTALVNLVLDMIANYDTYQQEAYRLSRNDDYAADLIAIYHQVARRGWTRGKRVMNIDGK